jgi:rRNA maturation protein Rpf1
MNESVLLEYALGIIGALLALLIANAIRALLGLKNDMRALAADLKIVSEMRVKLVHREDCRIATTRIFERLDEHDAELSELGERVAKTETYYDAWKRS